MEARSAADETHVNHSQMEKTFGGTIFVGRARRSAGSGWFRRSAGKHLWCSFCYRTFPNGTYRLFDGGRACPYADCNADIARDALGWNQVRQEQPNYPESPWLGIQYPPHVKAAGAA